ncbi:hypothetical protein K2W90_04400 [Candidatus Babeliales bacterium]|nr:hypothetical protein [Candidatus Babeliales bacterium]
MFGSSRFMQSRSFLFTCLVIVLACSSCNKQQDTHLAGQQHFLDTLDKAKRIDTPIPLGFFLINKQCSAQAETLTYHGSLAVNQVQDFYRKEMEREGWEIIDFSQEQEGMLFCQKTGRSCIVTAHKHRKKTVVRLFIKTTSFTDHGKLAHIVQDWPALTLSDITKDMYAARH